MAFSPIDSTAAAPAGTQSAAGQSQARIAQDFDTFLTILTTQLQNQDPLSPMDSSEFTDQLVSFAGVEQDIQANQNLETIAGLLTSGQQLSAVDYLDRTVTIIGDTVSYDGNLSNPLQYSYRLPVPAESTQLTVVNEENEAVLSQQGQTEAGLHSFNIPALNETGNPLPPGNYRLEVRALNETGDEILVQQFITDQVRSIDTSGPTPLLSVGTRQVSLSDIRTITD